MNANENGNVRSELTKDYFWGVFLRKGSENFHELQKLTQV